MIDATTRICTIQTLQYFLICYVEGNIRSIC